MVAYLTKSDASEGFNQIIYFLNESSIKYALTVNPNIYVSCIKQFWTIIVVKKVNDVIRLQALVDKKKVVVTESTIREVIRLDDAEGVECLPNKEIFTELARTGYEKPSIKLTFYKAFFSSQWKFLIYTISQCMSAKRTSWNEFSSSMTSAVICLSSAQEVEEEDTDENVENVNAGIAAEGDLLELDKIAQALEITKLKRRVKKLERRNKVKVLKLRRLQKVGTTQRVETSDDTVMNDVSNQERMVAEMDQDVDVVLEHDKEVIDDVKDVQEDIEDESEPAIVQKLVDVVTTAKIITEVVTTASESIIAASTTIIAAEARVPAATLTVSPSRVTAAPSRKRKGVVIRDPQEDSTTSTIIHVETKSKDKGKGILVEEPKPLKKQSQIEQDEKYSRELEAELNKNIDWDEVIDHVKKKAKEDPAVKRYQSLKRKPQTEAQARKKMMIYLKNVAGFKMDYFKGMFYDDIRPIFEAKFDSNVASL
nr:xylulose kinase-1 [Tanacetum cinerariifolium]